MPSKHPRPVGKSKTSPKHDGYRVQKSGTKSKTFTKSDRVKVMQDTIKKTSAIVAATPNSSTDSVFHDQQLQPLDYNDCPKLELKATRFLLGDTFAVTRQIMETAATEDSKGQPYTDKVAVLNMASDVKVAGANGIPSGPTQEDALCLSSTLYETLKKQSDKYPWKKSMAVHERANNHCAAIYSPHVVIFKDSSAKGYEELPESQRKIVGVISVAAPRDLKISADIPESIQKTKTTELKEKIRMIARIAARDQKSVLVLGAMGCGKFNCDPALVARTFRSVLTEEEFNGWFEQIVFAIYTQATLNTFQKRWES